MQQRTRRPAFNLRRYLFTPTVEGAFHHPSLQRVLFARPGQRIPTEERPFVGGCLVCVVFIPLWFVWLTSTSQHAIGAGTQDDPTSMLRSFGIPAVVLAVLVGAVMAARPLLSAPHRLARALAAGNVVALVQTDVVTRLAKLVQPEVGVPIDPRVQDQVVDHAVRLAAVEQMRRQARNLRRLVEWSDGIPTNTPTDAPTDSPTDQLSTVADRLDAAAADEQRLVVEWLSMQGPTGEASA